jgi:hypothetical protein
VAVAALVMSSAVAAAVAAVAALVAGPVIPHSTRPRFMLRTCWSGWIRTLETESLKSKRMFFCSPRFYSKWLQES